MDSGAIAALLGILIGSGATVVTTHLAGRHAHSREAKQRKYLYDADRLKAAEDLLSEFLGHWFKDAVKVAAKKADTDSMLELATLGSRIQLILPSLEDKVTNLLQATWAGGDAKKITKEKNVFLTAAREELKKLEPKL